MGGTAWVMPMVAATQPGELEDKKPLPLATNSLLPNTVPVVTRLAMMLMPPPPMLMLPLPCSRGPSLVCPGRTTPSTPRSRSQDLLVTVRLMEVTTRTPRLSARRSTSARPMALVGSPSTASSAPTEPSSTRTTSSATGGSTLTAPQLRSSTPSTTRSLQRGTPLLALVPMLLETMLLLLLSTVPRDLGLLPMKLLPGEDVSRVAEGGVKHLKAPNVPSPVLVN